MYQLPSPNFSSPEQPKGFRASTFIGIAIALWISAVVGYGAYRWLERAPKPEESKPNTAPTTAAIPADFSKHVASLEAESLKSEPNLRHAEDEIRRTLALTDNFTEARHLHRALADVEAAHQSLIRSRHDFDSLEVLVKGEYPK